MDARPPRACPAHSWASERALLGQARVRDDLFHLGGGGFPVGEAQEGGSGDEHEERQHQDRPGKPSACTAGGALGEDGAIAVACHGRIPSISLDCGSWIVDGEYEREVCYGDRMSTRLNSSH